MSILRTLLSGPFSRIRVRRTRLTVVPEDVVDLDAMSQDAKTAHNRAASRLSPEILEMVFWFAAAAWPASKRAEEGRRYDLGWIQITHVCRYWREVALRDHRLWSEISLDEMSAPWRSTMLYRSRKRPLALSVDLRRSEPKELDALCRIILDYYTLLRTEHLAVILPLGEEPTFEILVDVFESTRQAPILESLEIINDPKAYPYSILSSGSEPGVPPSPPNLKSLRLVNCCLDWRQPRFETLTHLDIEITSCRRMLFRHVATPRSIVTWLRSMPDLQTLRLRGIFYELTPEAMARQFESNEVAKLPKLSELWLHGPAQVCVAIAVHLEYPPTAHVQIYTPRGSATLDLPALFSRLPAMRTLQLDFRYWADLRIKLWASPHDPKSAQTATPNLDLRLGRSDDRVSQASYVTGNPLLGLNLESIVNLIVETGVTTRESWSGTRWRKLLAPAVNVRALHLTAEPAVAGAILALSSPVEGKLTSIHGPELMMLFPALEMLGISGLITRHTVVDGLSIWDALFQCLEMRRMRECSIGLVELPGPLSVYPPETPWKRLEGLVSVRIGECVG
ncbi:hypothetical protein BV25DRAFT_978094 [Artomyces pyxidatus]|uniref:Uncharacterized protein n=1 Tax=Artomyces pyxidatus TaxID=48021 RepID=A0ACB8SUK4_9AGAM|nr:hypothetical protein BV25DRAFT_978094 [Artomyces pyxidatus]